MVFIKGMHFSSMYSVLITGGSKGIGKASAEVFDNEGYEVCTPKRSELDLTSRESIFSFIKDNSDGFDVIVNNAGVNSINLIEGVSTSEMEETLMVNLIAPILLVKGFVPMMKLKRTGRIVNIGSIWNVVSKPGRSIYSSTKHGVHGLTTTWALELSKYNVLVNTVSPGFTLTDLTKKNNTQSELKKIEEKIPIGRLALPEEIAKIIFMLGSYSNTYITGQNIVVDGGYSIQ